MLIINIKYYNYIKIIHNDSEKLILNINPIESYFTIDKEFKPHNIFKLGIQVKRELLIETEEKSAEILEGINKIKGAILLLVYIFLYK